jgi:hypothetical protein
MGSKLNSERRDYDAARSSRHPGTHRSKVKMPLAAWRA